MRLVATASKTTASEDPDEVPMTPRGMAAPPARPAVRLGGDPSPPATIRIEASVRADPQRRSDLERELDRAHAAVATEQICFGHRLSWLLISQGLLLNAFVILLVFGWRAPLPGWRLLLGALALGGIVLAGLIDVAVRGGREVLRALKANRSDIEGRLEKEFNRAPRHRPHATPVRGFGLVAARALPITLITAWIALSVYALGVAPPPEVEARAAPRAVEPPAAKENLPPPSGRRSPFNS
jgi:hypothetical protein